MDGLFQGPFLIGGQIRDFVLAVDREQPDLLVGFEPVIDDPKPAALAFAAPRILSSQLPKSAGPLNHVAARRRCQQRLLQPPEVGIVQIVGCLPREQWGFDKGKPHRKSIR
jgi:hypothetical protein